MLASYDVIGWDETHYGDSEDSRTHHDPRHKFAAFGFLCDVTPSGENPICFGQTFGGCQEQSFYHFFHPPGFCLHGSIYVFLRA